MRMPKFYSIEILVFISGLSFGIASHIPKLLIPDVFVHYSPDGSLPLKVTCRGTERIIWKTQIPTEFWKEETSYEEGFYKSDFEVKEPVAEDSGNLSCKYAGSEKSANAYVHVYDNRTVFIMDGADEYQELSERGDQLDCRTTHPDFIVSVLDIQGKNASNLFINILNIFSMKGETRGFYKCFSQNFTRMRELENKVLIRKVRRAQTLSSISRANNSYPVVGQDFVLYCEPLPSRESGKKSVDFLEWKLPRKDNKTFKTEIVNGTNSQYLRLTVFNLTEEDSGRYYCDVDIFNAVGDSRIYTIEDKKDPVLEFHNDETSSKLVHPSGSEYRWKIQKFKAYPKDGFECLIRSPQKNISCFEETSLIEDFSFYDGFIKLSISEPTPKDSGNYTVILSNSTTRIHRTKTIIFYGKPVIEFDIENPYGFAKEKVQNISVSIFSFGGDEYTEVYNPPNITWKWGEGCISNQSCTLEEIKINTKEPIQLDPEIKYRAFLERKFKTSGLLQITASNENGTSYKQIEMQADIPPSLLNGSDLSMVDDLAQLKFNYSNSFNLTCFIGGRPKPSIKWFMDNVEIKDLDRYQATEKDIFCDSTEAKLEVRHAIREDEGRYECRAKNRAGEIKPSVNVEIIGLYISPTPTKIIAVAIIGLLLVITLIGTLIAMLFQIRKLRKNREILADYKQIIQDEKPVEIDKFKKENIIGHGEFGQVWKVSVEGFNNRFLAMKECRHIHNPFHVRALQEELKIMSSIGKHLNIVNMIGAYTKDLSKGKLSIFVEYCEHGCLKDHIVNNKKYFKNRFNIDSLQNGTITLNPTYTDSDDPVCPEGNNIFHAVACNISSPFNTNDLKLWSWQVANGMDYLSKQNVLHGDLATRNLLLAEYNIVKICDFGSSRHLLTKGYYRKKGQENIPYLWMAPEAIEHCKYSTQSDIWAYGVTIWEIFSLGAIPSYPFKIDDKNPKFFQIHVDRLKKGIRLRKPYHCDQKLYDLMLSCWNINPMKRPSFEEIKETLFQMISPETLRNLIITENNFQNNQVQQTHPDTGYSKHSFIAAQSPQPSIPEKDANQFKKEVGVFRAGVASIYCVIRNLIDHSRSKINNQSNESDPEASTSGCRLLPKEQMITVKTGMDASTLGCRLLPAEQRITIKTDPEVSTSECRLLRSKPINTVSHVHALSPSSSLAQTAAGENRSICVNANAITGVTEIPINSNGTRIAISTNSILNNNEIANNIQNTSYVSYSSLSNSGMDELTKTPQTSSKRGYVSVDFCSGNESNFEDELSEQMLLEANSMPSAGYSRICSDPSPE